MLKPTKEWTVDGQIFSSYSEACAHAKKFAGDIFRKNLIDDLRKILRDQPYGEATENGAGEITDRLLRLYEMKRKAV